MKQIKRLSISGKLPKLTKDAQEHLKGGFGLVGTSSIGTRGTNTNCTTANDAAHCNFKKL